MSFFHSLFSSGKNKNSKKKNMVLFHSLAKKEVVYFCVHERLTYDSARQLDPIRQALLRGVKCTFVFADDLPLSQEFVELMQVFAQQVSLYLIHDHTYLQHRRARRHGRDILIVDNEHIRYCYPRRQKGKESGWWNLSGVILNDVPNTIQAQRTYIERVIRLSSTLTSVDDVHPTHNA